MGSLPVGPSPTLGATANWRTVTLFDWIYDGEKPYAALKRAAELAGDQGWVAKRLAQGQKVPQASARELAQKLEAVDGLDPAVEADLKQWFADESEQLAKGSQADASQRAAAVDATLVDAAQRLDALEASLAKNSYGKGSSTGTTLNIYSGYRLDDPAGMDQGNEHGYLAGGLEVNFAGTIDKVNYTIELGAEYFYSALNTANVGNPGPQDADEEQGTYDAGVSFQFPLGNSGGLDVNLGSGQDLELSPLLFASIVPINTDAFFVDVLAPFRAPKIVKTMELNYPAGTAHFRGLTVKKSGTSWWWPFSLTTFVYAQDTTWWQSYDPKFDTMALRLDEDLGQRGNWLDGALVYAMAQTEGNDLDQMEGAGEGGTIIPAIASGGTAINGNTGIGGNPTLFPQRTRSLGAGSLLRLSEGAILHIDAAASAYDWQFGYGGAPTQSYSDTAFLVTLAQPLGPVNLALQLDQVGPHFLSAPRTAARNQTSWGPGGAIQDSIADSYPYVDMTELQEYAAAHPNTAPTLGWISMINQPSVATNNTRQAALTGEWHGSWTSVGLYDGAQEQINATDAYVWTTPYIEGNQNDGYGWFRMFGNEFSQVPAASGTPVIGGTAPFNAGQLLQQSFNKPTDGYARYRTGTGPGGQPVYAAMPVHWQQMSQFNNYETEFTTLLSQDGAGDGNVLADSAKTLNYAGIHLLFDIAALMNRNLPLEVTVVSEDRDLSTAPGLPGGGSSLFNQQFEVAFLNWGVTDMVTLLGTAGFETWKTQQSYYPVDMQIREFGAGADMAADKFVTGMALNFRASWMNFEDLNIGSRELELFTLSLGTTLTY